MSYTKGKWSWDGQNVIDGQGWSVAEVYARLCDGETEANAHLIKASPAMYEALKQLKNLLFCKAVLSDADIYCSKLIDAAIKQAEGGE